MDNIELYRREEYNGIKSRMTTCPFDLGGFGTQEQYLLDESPAWLWLVNPFPYWRYQTMLVPKRHIEGIDQLTVDEFLDFQTEFKFVLDQYSDLNLLHADGDPVKNYVLLWRAREKNQSNGVKVLDHLHVHVAPDKEGRWDPILDDDAYLTDIKQLKRIYA